MPKISVVVPARNEAGALGDLVAEIHRALAAEDHEVIVVDDGSSDATPQVLSELAAADGRLRPVRHPVSCGQSAAVYTGIRAARGEIIVTLDGDGQNDPAFVPALIAALEDPEVGLAAGQRVGRKASWSKRWGSRIANGVRGWMLQDGTRDSGCGLKAGRREALEGLPYFDSLHRFLPALVLADGWKVAHVDVIDRPRLKGTSNYGILDRLAVGIPDLFGVAWLTRRRRRRRPLRPL
ncbi:glycosyltransferase family 2 protein [Lutibaculum baratangense]|uniref:Dolichol-phosphate mannosyltransferase n=1 Tax=Lutibaculum baratangense AMV1 TaxID=631454 RepID=V4RR54_9HYPH|nr:glycosyltransferase family 2 protein [Lutibaculum baratangense]ESR25630.1 Dolichol-phosphate mannosyltransferase [Lutibaculum baratangense AMV1]